MATTITFTDAIGAATLRNGNPVPADRFSNWVTRSLPFGDKAHRQSDGALTRIRLRDDFGASFELRDIPVRTTGGARLVDVADRLIYHLQNGGTCAINTGDVESNAYATCGLWPDAEPDLRLADSRLLLYTLSLTVINLAGSPVRMVCHYDA